MPSASKPSGKARHLRLAKADGAESPRAPTDEELIDAFERGDAASVDAIYGRLIGIVDGTICRIMGRREVDHADLVQSSFEQIVLTLTQGRFARACGLGAWAAAITTHVALKTLRARINERRVLDRSARRQGELPEPAAPDNVEREATTREAFDRLRLHLAEMDSAKAVTVYLHDGLGHDLAEIATLTNVSVAAAQSRLVRGREELRHRMSGGRGPTAGGWKDGEP